MDDVLDVRVELSDVAVGVVRGRGCRVAPGAAGLDAAVKHAIGQVDRCADLEEVRTAVRGMLRHGKYKPTGRGKPASEYLLGAARQGRFPRINNLVDINNLVSLEYLLPISVIDLQRAATRQLIVRRGREGERYVFNDVGQAIELHDLLLVATGDGAPCANPVKDSMATKVHEATREVAAVLYAPCGYEATLRSATERFAQALERWAEAEITERRVVAGP